MLTSSTTITDSGGTGVTFADSVDGDGQGPWTLSLDVSATTIFNAAVGQAHALRDLVTSSPGTTVLAGETVTTVGSQIYGDAVLLTADTTLRARDASLQSNVVFGGPLDSSGTDLFALTIDVDGEGRVRFEKPIGSKQPLSGLFISGPALELGPGTITLNGPSAEFDSPARLTEDLEITERGTGDVVFASTVDSPGMPSDLTVTTAGGGDTRFQGEVGGDAPLGSVTTDAAGTTFLRADVTTAGEQTYNDPVVTRADVTLTTNAPAGDVTFASSVDSGVAGPSSVTVNTDGGGQTSFGGPVGQTRPLRSIRTDPAGEVQIDADVRTTGPQVYGEQVMVGRDADIRAGRVEFQGGVESAGGRLEVGRNRNVAEVVPPEDQAEEAQTAETASGVTLPPELRNYRSVVTVQSSVDSYMLQATAGFDPTEFLAYLQRNPSERETRSILKSLREALSTIDASDLSAEEKARRRQELLRRFTPPGVDPSQMEAVVEAME